MVEDLVVRPYHPFTRASALPVRSGEVYEVWIELVATAARLPAGHTLRLAIQLSDWPHLSPTVSQSQATGGTVVRLYHDTVHPSVLAVPLE